MVIFGVDPGVNGAISILKNKTIVDVYDMPTMIEGKKNKKQLNGPYLAKIIKGYIQDKKLINEEFVLIVEQVSAMPGQGVTSMFNFGQSYGVIKGICSALLLPIYFVRPTKWKKHYNLINTNKDASRTKAIEIYPDISSQLSRKKDLNKADSILIARYFFETYHQQ
tara:strand:- start:567 stop:1064 length:498 start_codon:yes stop_codon:yes gene_type:complete